MISKMEYLAATLFLESLDSKLVLYIPEERSLNSHHIYIQSFDLNPVMYGSIHQKVVTKENASYVQRVTKPCLWVQQ